jgi:hypothetical protein
MVDPAGAAVGVDQRQRRVVDVRGHLIDWLYAGADMSTAWRTPVMSQQRPSAATSAGSAAAVSSMLSPSKACDSL